MMILTRVSQMMITHHNKLGSSHFMQFTTYPGTFLNEEIQQTGSVDKNSLNKDTLGVKEFYRTAATRGLVQWPSSEVHNFDQCEYNTVMCW